MIALLLACAEPAPTQLVLPPELEVHPHRVLVADEEGRMRVLEVWDDPLAEVARLRAQGLHAEPDVRVHMTGERGGRGGLLESGEDPLRSLQWHMDTLDEPALAELEDGSGVLVAVIDSGVSTREDAPEQLRFGHDHVDEDSDPSDEEGHGTHVAGTIAQATGNGVGVHGLAPGVEILAIRVLDEEGSGWTSDTIEGIDEAVEAGADILNLSLGTAYESDLQREAVQRAEDAGALVVAAVGNSGTEGALYPAAFEEVLGVGAVDLELQRTDYSNTGEAVELCAPGGDNSADLDGNGQPDGVLQETFSGDTWSYWWYQGTSMAAPHVSASAALVMARGLDASATRTALSDHARDLGAEGWDSSCGYGLVDPLAVLGAEEEEETDTGPLLELVALASGEQRYVAFELEEVQEVGVCDDTGSCLRFPPTLFVATGWFHAPEASSFTVELRTPAGEAELWGPYAFSTASTR